MLDAKAVRHANEAAKKEDIDSPEETDSDESDDSAVSDVGTIKLGLVFGNLKQ